MDEIEEVTMIRNLLPASDDPPPGVASSAWAALEQQMRAASPAPGIAARPGAPTPRPRRRLLTRPLLLGGVTAGAAALAVGVLAVGQPGFGGPASPAGSALPRSTAGGPSYVIRQERPLGGATGQPAKAILLSVAGTVAHTAAAAGKYWCDVAVSAVIALPGQGATPSPASDYRYTRQFRTETCWQPGRTGLVASSNQVLGPRPDSPAWRKAVAPGLWRARHGGQPIGTGWVGPGKPGGSGSLGDGVPVPTDPAKLRAALLAQARSQTPPYIWQYPAKQATALALFFQARTLLLFPLTPAQRAADYQVLAGVPGLRTKPGVKDPSGRVGTAMWLGSPTEISIIDPGSGMLLADEWLTSGSSQPSAYAPGTVIQYSLWTSNWTDKLP